MQIDYDVGERFDAAPLGAEDEDRLAILDLQRADLAACLNTLWQDVLASRRRFKLYRQMKMYNDPTLNPILYRKESAALSKRDES